jgi:hypothetical protein
VPSSSVPASPTGACTRVATPTPSWPSRAGVRLDVVSKQLGHASVVITADVYGHPGTEALEEAARKMGTVLGKGAP